MGRLSIDNRWSRRDLISQETDDEKAMGETGDHDDRRATGEAPLSYISLAFSSTARQTHREEELVVVRL
jgi:hypothetical protein